MVLISNEGWEEYYAQFIRVEGERGTVLIFCTEKNDEDEALANEIAVIIDKRR